MKAKTCYFGYYNTSFVLFFLKICIKLDFLIQYEFYLLENFIIFIMIIITLVNNTTLITRKRK